MKYIICGGMPRSGSTLQFNIVRELASAAWPTERVVGGYGYENTTKRPFDVAIVKIHTVAEIVEQGFPVVSTIRDIRDVAASLIRMGWCDCDVKSIYSKLDSYVVRLREWEAIADKVVPYSLLAGDLNAAVLTHAALIDSKLGKKQLTEVTASISLLRPQADKPVGSPTRFDPVSLLHDGHIASSPHPARSALPPSIVAAIEDRYGEWLSAYGYSLD